MSTEGFTVRFHSASKKFEVNFEQEEKASLETVLVDGRNYSIKGEKQYVDIIKDLIGKSNTKDLKLTFSDLEKMLHQTCAADIQHSTTERVCQVAESRMTTVKEANLSSNSTAPGSLENFSFKATQLNVRYNELKSEKIALIELISESLTPNLQGRTQRFNESVEKYNKEAQEFQNEFEDVFFQTPNQYYSQEIISPPEVKACPIGNRTLSYTISGAENHQKGQPTFILEAGHSSLGSYDWHLSQPKIAEFAQVVSYDRAGLGRSPASSSQETAGNLLDTVEKDFHQLLNHLKEQGVNPPYVLVGHSLGGVYIQNYALEHPDVISGLVLIDSTSENEFLKKDSNTQSVQKPTTSPIDNLSEPKKFFSIANGIESQLNPTGVPPFLKNVTEKKKKEAAWLVCQQKNSDNWLVEHQQMDQIAKTFAQKIETLESDRPFGKMPLLSIGRKVARELSESEADYKEEVEYQEWRQKMSERSEKGDFVTSEIADHNMPYFEPDFIVSHLKAFMNKHQNTWS